MNNEIKSNDLPFATDTECERIRYNLISKGMIIENLNHTVTKKNGNEAVSTNENCKSLRNYLIKKGILSNNLCEVNTRKNLPTSLEEGKYETRPIQSDADYYSRRQAYWRVLQEVLISRINLNLILGSIKQSDPDWIF